MPDTVGHCYTTLIYCFLHMDNGSDYIAVFKQVWEASQDPIASLGVLLLLLEALTYE